MKKTTPDEEPRSPIPFTHGSNGEYVPRTPGPRARRAEELFRRLVDERARKLGITRRRFVESAAGAATALLVINACGDSSEGRYAVDASQTWDADAACEALGGNDFVFDVQTHHVNPEGAWRDGNAGWELFLSSLPQGSCGGDAVTCFDTQHYLREMFLNSETAVAVLSAVPADPGANPLEVDEARATVDLMASLSGSQRMVMHGLVLPDQAGQLDLMQGLVETYGISAWKVYTPYGGWRLDDEAVGIPFIERARSLGLKRVCAHKGLPLFNFDPAFASPDDIGVVAAAYPDVTFVVYHSGYETDTTEGPYQATSPQGIDRLIKTCLDHGVGAGGTTRNVYAELGTTWRSVMTDPTQAAHVVGKLMRYLGPDRILWGTDSIWYGSPQDQITAFRALEIPQAMQEAYSYPPLSADNRAKIFGLNAAELYGVDPAAVRCAIDADDLATLRRQAREGGGSPTFRAYGPQTRREMLSFLRARGGRPG